MTEEVQETLPIENIPPPADPPAEPEVVAAEPEAAPEAEPQPEPEPKKQPWFLQRISEESAKRSAAEQRAIDAERRARAAEELLQRPSDKQALVPPPETQFNELNRAEIAAEATRQRLYEDSAEIRNRGLAQFGARFNDTVGILNAVGAASDEFVADVLAVDKASAHVLLNRIAQEPDRAVVLAQMNSRQRIAELTKMYIKEIEGQMASENNVPANAKTTSAPTPKGISKAPAPAPALQPTAHKTINFQSPESDKLTDKEFFAQLDEHMQKSGRHARR